MSSPKTGQPVRLRYAKKRAHLFHLHGAEGVVRVVGTGRPRNHGVEIGGEIVILPAGNLIPSPAPGETPDPP